MEKKEIPSIKLLSAISPTATDDRHHALVSANIDAYVDQYAPYEHELWEDFLTAEKGSIEEESLGRTLAEVYLLKTSKKLSSPDESAWGRERDEWAERFTHSSTELYSAPHINFVRGIIGQQAKQFDRVDSASGTHVQGVYERLKQAASAPEIQDGDNVALETLNEQQQEQLAATFFEMNSDWFEYLSGHEKESYTPAELKELFDELILLRAETDERWRGWTAQIDENKSQVSVLASEQKVSVGAGRASATRQEAIGLVAHELGVHAQRAVNGGEIDASLGEGLPGYIEIEESFGILSELFSTGEMPEKAQDRYIDIALAMGVIPETVLSREELIDLAYHRNVARLEARGESPDDEQHSDALKRATIHINRIFRGGDGFDGGPPAVFTKDAVYYPAELEGYLADQLNAGKTPEQILTFLLSGKFDPTNESHLAYLSQHGIQL